MEYMNNNIIDIEKLVNSTILVWGYGLEGKSTVDFLVRRGVKKNIFVATQDKIEINVDNVNFILEKDIIKYDFDFVIKSSGISVYKQEYKMLEDKEKSKKTVITSNLNILLSIIKTENKNLKVIGITGTKGKSTTSSIMYYILKNLNYKVALLGNIGISFLNVINEIKNYDYIVLELSSYQIKTLNCGYLDYGIILNLFPEHIDWHLNHENYFKDKLNIANYSKKFIFNKNDKNIQKYLQTTNKQNFVGFNCTNGFYIKNGFIMDNDKKIFDINSISNIKGEHIFTNVCSLLTVLKMENIDINKALDKLNIFQTLKHRLDVFYNDKKNNTIYVNDSISTIPEATIEAIKTFKNNNIFLILGGFDRQQNYEQLIDTILKKDNNIKKVFLLGQTGNRLKKLLVNSIDCEYFSSLENLVKSIKCNNLENTTVLLSPAAASYDMFKNFEQRGNMFEQLMLM